MGEKNVKVLGTKLSPYSHRIEWALKLKGIEYELQVEELKNKSNTFLELNPVYKKVPVLVHGGEAISESLIILEYIDETWKDDDASILQKDPSERAYARFWAKFIDDKLIVSAKEALFYTGEEQAKTLETVAECLQLIEGEIEKNGRKFFGGEKIGFLDIVLGWMYWYKFAEETAGLKVSNSEKYPALGSWFSKFVNVPVIKQNLPPPSELYRVSQMMHKKWLEETEGAN